VAFRITPLKSAFVGGPISSQIASFTELFKSWLHAYVDLIAKRLQKHGCATGGHGCGGSST
jgi:hypothetical protein